MKSGRSHDSTVSQGSRASLAMLFMVVAGACSRGPADKGVTGGGGDKGPVAAGGSAAMVGSGGGAGASAAGAGGRSASGGEGGALGGEGGALGGLGGALGGLGGTAADTPDGSADGPSNDSDDDSCPAEVPPGPCCGGLAGTSCTTRNLICWVTFEVPGWPPCSGPTTPARFQYRCDGTMFVVTGTHWDPGCLPEDAGVGTGGMSGGDAGGSTGAGGAGGVAFPGS